MNSNFQKTIEKTFAWGAVRKSEKTPRTDWTSERPSRLSRQQGEYACYRMLFLLASLATFS